MCPLSTGRDEKDGIILNPIPTFKSQLLHLYIKTFPFEPMASDSSTFFPKPVTVIHGLTRDPAQWRALDLASQMSSRVVPASWASSMWVIYSVP